MSLPARCQPSSNIFILIAICLLASWIIFNLGYLSGLNHRRWEVVEGPSGDVSALSRALIDKIKTANNILGDVDLDWYPGGIRGDNETGWPMSIVPNIFHYILFQDHELRLVHFISILSVLRNHGPAQIFIHCDCVTLHGPLWDILMGKDPRLTPWIWQLAPEDNIRIIPAKRPEQIFGHKFNSKYINFHASDVKRLEVLMQWGGVYIDRDVYVVKSLRPFFHYEMVLTWDPNSMGSLVDTWAYVANPNARYLRAAYETYRKYDPDADYFYNAGYIPTHEVAEKHPDWIHRVFRNETFGENCTLYYRTDTSEWREPHYLFHLGMKGGRPSNFNWCLDLPKPEDAPEYTFESLMTDDTTFGRMARLAMFGSERKRWDDFRPLS